MVASGDQGVPASVHGLPVHGSVTSGAGNHYSFRTVWRVTGTIAEVTDIFNDPTGMPRWWPSVYLNVEELEPGDATGRGRVISLFTTGWLPYTLRWRFQVTRVDDRSCEFRAWGDFVGTGGYEMTRLGDEVEIVWIWRVLADKPLIRDCSFLFKPVFAANHQWAMRQGLRALRLELLRRRAATPAELAAIPAPRPRVNALPMLLGAAATALITLAAVLRLRRR